MPLNRLTVRETDYPQTDDALPMVTKLQYAERFDKAMRYIFGKTMICRNLEVATHLARTTGLDCVTLDGDQVSSKGSLTGGYVNTSRCRLEVYKTRSSLSAQVSEKEAELAACRAKLQQVEGEVNQLLSEIQRTETKNSKSKVCRT
jgi:structural maintenance of chromosome 3 (chondroitin sulfate proteoglycan 6)